MARFIAQVSQTVGKMTKLTLLLERSETLPVPSSTVPFRQDPDFVDRGSLLDEILEKAAPGARLALVGLGGVG